MTRKLKKNLSILVLSGLGVLYTYAFLEGAKPLGNKVLNKPVSVKIQENNSSINTLSVQTKQDITVSIIKDYILSNNDVRKKKISDKEAEKMAVCVTNEARARNLSPYYLAAIPKTESGFDKDAVHGLSYVHGLCGVSYKDWGVYLKDKNIISKESDLKDVETNIKASAEILAYYNGVSKTPREAVTRYKGYCKVGAERASKVVRIAVMLKNKEKSYS